MNEVFNNPARFVEGWYWALPSSAVRRGQARAVSLLGRDLVVYRGDDGAARALDAYCPHMGAHLGVGTVEGTSLRCLFHRWKYGPDGRCAEIPSLGGEARPDVRTAAWPVGEKYGLIWVWTGATPRQPLPHVPELGAGDCDAHLGGPFVKKCHPHVVLVNAIDEHHFNSVHRLHARIRMESHAEDDHRIDFRNTTRATGDGLLARLLRRLYPGVLTYALTYWGASTGTVTIGPDRLHFHILFALRPTAEGQTEGQAVFITRRRPGPFGWLMNRFLLPLTRIVSDYFATGDTRIFQTIRFQLRTPIASDHAVLDFIRHTERQRTLPWGSFVEEPDARASWARQALGGRTP